jgi:hypothetical protein
VLEIPSNAPKPISFQVIDSKYAFIGLRSYSPDLSTISMKRAMCCDSKPVADAFAEVFNEYWRGARFMNPEELREKAKSLNGISSSAKDNADKVLVRLFKKND